MKFLRANLKKLGKEIKKLNYRLGVFDLMDLCHETLPSKRRTCLSLSVLALLILSFLRIEFFRLQLPLAERCLNSGWMNSHDMGHIGSGVV